MNAAGQPLRHGDQAHRPFPHDMMGSTFYQRKSKRPFVVYRDSEGERPCIPPHVLGPMVDRIGLRCRVARDERQEANPTPQTSVVTRGGAR